MLRLVSSARSRLLRVGAVRVAAVRVAAVGAAPRAPHLAKSTVPLHGPYELPRFSSSDADGHDRPRWKTRAVNDPVAWQEAVKPSLSTFFKLKKHLMVPVAFVVPYGDEAWPKAAWGYPLGKHAEWLRKQWREGGRKIDPKQRKELDEMDFAWDGIQYKWDRFILPSLRRFYELNGHTDVSKYFRVPRGSSDWPEHLWDHYLGSKVENILQRGDFIEQVKTDKDELERLNFRVGLALSSHKRREKLVPAVKAALDKASSLMRNDPEWKWRERIMPALGAFYRLHGHCRVPRSYPVPSHEDWPRLSWGLNLGALVNRMRSLGRYSAQVTRDKARLEELGFVWDIYEFEWSERIMPALEAFRRLNGHCRVPRKFTVPSHEDWPRLSWGLNLGSVANNIRKGAYFTQVTSSKTRLEELGFVWDFYESEWGERILPALENFHHLHGHCRVPAAFEVSGRHAGPRNCTVSGWVLQ